MRAIHRPWAALGILCLTLGTAAWSQAPATVPVDSATVAPKAPVAQPTPAAAPVQPAAAPSIYSQPSPAARPSQRQDRGNRSPEPMLACFLGVMPLASGYYMTSTPMKGAIFTLGDAVLIGTIMNIRKDDNIPDGDVVPYFYLIGAVNAVDAALSFIQSKHDLEVLRNARVQASLNPSGDPVIGMAWTF